MKRWPAVLLLLGCAVATCASTAEAGPKRFQRLKREPKNAQQQQLQDYPPRYVRAPNSQNYVFRDKAGQVHVRKVPSGYAEQFPTPAMFYYGYPHSGDDTGLGF
jgi:hypothetical protein